MKHFFLLYLIIFSSLTNLKSQNIFETIGNDSLALLQNGYIVGPNNIDCGRNVHTVSKWVNVNGVGTLRVLTFQHRFYDKSVIYDQNNNEIWRWNGESFSDTWYARWHTVSVVGNSKVRLEFTQGFRDPFCLGRLQVVGISKGNYNGSLEPSISKSSNLNNNTRIVSNNIGFNNSASILNSVKIGNQEWSQKNLDVSTFRNGDPITQVYSDVQWREAGKRKQPAWCYYNNDPKNGEKYGKLYNWWAVNDPRGLAPSGWHIATDIEWKILVNYIGGSFKSELGVSGYTSVGKKLKAMESWKIGRNDDYSSTQILNGNGTNESKFSALAAGFRFDGITEKTPYPVLFGIINEQAVWWSSSEYDGEKAISFRLKWNSDNLFRNSEYKNHGMSVRCIKGERAFYDNNILKLYYASNNSLFDFWSEEQIYPDKNGVFDIYYANEKDKSPRRFIGSAKDLEFLIAYKFKNMVTYEFWSKGVPFTKQNLSKANEVNSGINCSYSFVRPSQIIFKFNDNRKLCDCCSEKYIRNERRTPQAIEGDKAHLYETRIKAKLNEHLEKVKASEEHRKNDEKRLEHFVAKTYTNIKHYESWFLRGNGTVYFGINNNEIDLYQNYIDYRGNNEKYCSKRCYLICK